jgi:hypothetical protein
VNASRDTFCRRQPDAAAWAAGALPEREREEFENHRRICPVCTSEAEACSRLIGRLRAAPAAPADASDASGFTDRVMAALPADAFRRPHARNRLLRLLAAPPRLAWPAAAAAALVAAACAWQVSRGWAAPAAVVRAGRAWIAQQQEPDGTWNPARTGGAPAYRPALTALAALALDGEAGRYRPALDAAAGALVRLQRPDGGIGAEDGARMYNHALATCALLATYAGGGRPELREPLDRAVGFIRQRQQPGGGWGYGMAPAEDANTGVSVWQVEALARARAAGWNDSAGHLRRGWAWLRQRTGGDGRFGYRTAGDAAGTPTLDAMGAYALLRACAAQPELAAAADAAVRRLRAEAAADGAHGADFYRAFFTAAAWDAAGDAGRARTVRREVRAGRDTAGAERNSWAPRDAWGDVSGRVGATALAVMTLQS